VKASFIMTPRIADIAHGEQDENNNFVAPTRQLPMSRRGSIAAVANSNPQIRTGPLPCSLPHIA
jgi:hypothetical protein